MKLLFKKVIKRATIFRIREIIEGYHSSPYSRAAITSRLGMAG